MRQDHTQEQSPDVVPLATTRDQPQVSLLKPLGRHCSPLDASGSHTRTEPRCYATRDNSRPASSESTQALRASLQPFGCVRIIHKNRAQMLCRSRQLETSLK
ncbi:hypothetical protein O0L34_g8352 [Tuta absoluta]|nr:hypothetical protein O0L34_g8352 [Tuta absoluta]